MKRKPRAVRASTVVDSALARPRQLFDSQPGSDPKVEEQLKIAREFMNQYRDTFRALAK